MSDDGDDGRLQACPNAISDCNPTRPYRVVIRASDLKKNMGCAGYDTTKKWLSVYDVLCYKIFPWLC